MPYTVKSTITWHDESLSVDDRVAKIRSLYDNDVEFDPSAVQGLRHEALKNDYLLARGTTIADDGLSIITTSIWKSQAAFEKYQNTQEVNDYLTSMRNYGWKVDLIAL